VVQRIGNEHGLGQSLVVHIVLGSSVKLTFEKTAATSTRQLLNLFYM
jgi:hypothetical protein